MLPVEASLNRKAMCENGSQARYSSSPVMPPRMLTTLVVPTPCGWGLAHVTLVMAVAQCGHDSASSSTSHTCSGEMGRSTVLTNRKGAMSTKSSPTRSHGFMAIHARAWCLAGAVARRRKQSNQAVADRSGEPVACSLARDHTVADIPFQPPVRLAVGEHRRGHVLGCLREHADDLVDHVVVEVGTLC